MLGDLNLLQNDCRGLGMTITRDPLELINIRPNLNAGWQAQKCAGMRNLFATDEYIKSLAGLADANAKKRLEEETKKYTRLEF